MSRDQYRNRNLENLHYVLSISSPDSMFQHVCHSSTYFDIDSTWLVVWNMFIFHHVSIYWKKHIIPIPNDFHISQWGSLKPPTSYNISWCWMIFSWLPTIVVQSSVLLSYLKMIEPPGGGEWQRALLLLSLARASSKAKHVVYNAAISACSLAGLAWEMGKLDHSDSV